MSALSDLMGVLLPGGLAAGVVLLVQAVRSWRESRTAREETMIERLQRHLRERDERVEVAEQDEAYAIVLADHWRQRSADLEFEMRKHGLDIPTRPPLPQKQRRVKTSAQARTQKRLDRSRRVEEDLE